MVAENSLTITEGEEHEDRGETDLKDKEEMTAEVTEDVQETAIAEETPAAEEVEAVVIAEDTPTEDNDEEKEEVVEDEPEDDPEDRANAEVQDAQAEVLEHSVDVHESVENWGGEPLHVTEVRERVVETLEQAENVIAEKDQKINELETRIAELEQIEKNYNAIMAEREAVVLAEKREKAKAFAEKQGLNVEDTAVAEAISDLDYAKIAELTMAQVADEEPETVEEKPAQKITLASFVELDVGDNAYGGLLNRRNK